MPVYKRFVDRDKAFAARAKPTGPLHRSPPRRVSDSSKGVTPMKRKNTMDPESNGEGGGPIRNHNQTLVKVRANAMDPESNGEGGGPIRNHSQTLIQVRANAGHKGG